MHSIKKITVQEICNKANVNRTTFYAHFTDIYDLQNKIEQQLSTQMIEIFEEAIHDRSKMKNALREMFYFIEKHKSFYQIFLKHSNLSILKTILDSSDFSDIGNPRNCYRVSYFTGGISAMLRIWLDNNCQEKVEELINIIYDHY